MSVVLKDQGRTRRNQQKRKRLAETQVVELAVKLPADPGSHQQRRQHDNQHYQTGSIESHPDDTGKRDTLDDNDIRLIDGTGNFLRPAAQLGPDCRYHSGIAANSAQNAANKAHTCIGYPSAGRNGIETWGDKRIGPKSKQKGAEHDFQHLGIGAREKVDPNWNSREAAGDEGPKLAGLN